MGLFSPWFLAGLAVLGLPLWLHLLRQFKSRPQPFSSLMFFERNIQSSTKHRRLRYLTLLVMRLLLLLLLVLAFANPFINRSESTGTRRGMTVIALDRSFSMRYGKHFADAKAQAHKIINSLRPNALAQVVAFDAHVETFSGPERDKAALHAAIDAIQAGDESSSYGEFSRAMRILDQTTGMQIDARIVTDLQQTSMPAAFSDLQLGPHTSLKIHCVGSNTEPNWAIDTVNVPAHFYDVAHTRLTATVASWQSQPTSKRVSLFLDGHLAGSKDVNVPAGGRATVEFTGFDVPYGAHRGELRMEPADSLPNDDHFFFSVERSDPRPVLFLYSGNHAREAFYYRSALEASKGTGLRMEAAPIESVAGETFKNCAFVVIENPGTLETAQEQALREYVERGGAALIAVGPATAHIHTVPLAGNEVAITTTTQGAGTVDIQSPALGGLQPFQNVQFVTTPRITAASTDRLLARFADNSPLLIEKRLGEGRLLLFASALDNSTSDFPLHASYLPFVAQTGMYLAGSEDEPSSLPVGTPASLRQAKAQTSAADVIGPDGKHALALSEAAKALTYTLDREGFYEIQRASGQRILLAAHADRRESDLTKIPADTLALWRNTGTSAIETGDRSTLQTVRWSLWRYLLTLVLLAAIVESVFAARYLKQGRQTS